jgi:hypothetical protein
MQSGSTWLSSLNWTSSAARSALPTTRVPKLGHGGDIIESRDANRQLVHVHGSPLA